MASLTQRSGVLGRRLAGHLLRRCTYHVTPSRIDDFAGKTANDAVDELFEPIINPNGEVYEGLYPKGPLDPDGDHYFSISENDHEPGASASNNVRVRAITTWRVYECMNDTTIKWKLANWIGSIYSVYHSGLLINYHYWRLAERMAFDNLKSLASKMTFDLNMLIYLNNRLNNKNAPNENYAREFLELFTILKGEPAGIGNYTNYTEADITQAARVLTGIKTGNPTIDPDTGIIRGKPVFTQHDTGDKTFSSAFTDASGNTYTIAGATNEAGVYAEVDQFIEMVFDQEATAQNYVRKLYRYFVNDKITPEIETDIIIPLGTTLLNNGYQHVPVLKELLKSLHFYDEDDTENEDEIVGAKIKSPYEMLFTTANLLETSNLNTANHQATFYNNFNSLVAHHLDNVGLSMRGPITVEGFPGFYDAPGYSKNWFNANYVYERFTYGVSFKNGKIRNTNFAFPYKVDLMNWVNNNIEVAGGPGVDPSAPIGAADAFKVVNDMLSYLLAEMPVGDRLSYFENQLLGGLSPINWYFSWKDYLNSGNETDVLLGITNLYDAILSSPEFQTF